MEAVKIIDFINSIIEDKSKEVIGYKDCFAVNSSGYKGIAIKSSNKVIINETFNKVNIMSCKINISNEVFDVVFLYTNEPILSYHYGMLCLDFLNKKDQIIKDPLSWFNEWKDLLGNYKKEKIVYDVIGEMKFLLHLQMENKNPQWDSMIGGTFDIFTDEAFYEVKTTKSKSIENVVIHSQYQLNTKGLNELLYICLCKVEENAAGDSIESLYNELIKYGYDKISLDEYLNKIGFGIGKAERYTNYFVHEIKLYLVDDKFPKITNDSFKNDQVPNGIVSYQYTISLDGLEYTKIL